MKKRTRTIVLGIFTACLIMVTSCEAFVSRKIEKKMAADMTAGIMKEVCSNKPNVTISYNGKLMTETASLSAGTCWMKGQFKKGEIIGGTPSDFQLYCGTASDMQFPKDPIFLGKAKDGRESVSIGPSDFVCENTAGKFEKENVYYVNFPK